MELGLGFLVGALAGSVGSVIVAMIVMVSRKAIKSGNTKAVEAKPAANGANAAKAAASVRADGNHGGEIPRHQGATTMIVESVDLRDTALAKSIEEVKELLLRLADVISNTDDATGKAAKAFTSAKTAIGKLDLCKPDGLAEAQRILMGEIDRVLKTNAALHGELEKANKGIAEQRRQIEELRVQARIDGLTRIPNRAAFDERLEEYLSLLDRADMMFSLLLIDIDLFKKVNDDYGHLNGDRILRGVAARISDSVRANDFAARYGGEEFAVILPATPLEEALVVAERIRADIARTNFRLDDRNVRMTVSGGLAQSQKGMNAEGVLGAADHALYQAKNGGRNRVEVAK